MLRKIIIVSVVALFISAGAWYFSQTRTMLTITSPTGEYSVVLREDALSPILYETLIKFQVERSGKEFVTSTYLDGYDGLEPGFLERFPSHAWIKDSVLIFESSRYAHSDTTRFSIANRSGRPVKYVRIFAGDILLAFDLMPGQKIEFAMPSQKHNKWIQVHGAFGDDSLFEEGFNFSDDDRIMALNSCSVIKILENDIDISEGSASDCEG